MAAERARDPWCTPEERTLFLRLVLWSVGRLRAPITAFGIDYPLFRELLRVRIVLGVRPKDAKTSAWGVAGSALAILMAWFAGLATGLTALVQKDPGVWVVASQSLLMLLLALLLFQVLAGILVDPTDIGVVAAHPIRDRTVFAVRLAEVGLYVLVFVASFSAGSMMLAVFGQPPLAVLFVYPLLSLLAGATTLGLVALLFALCLRIVGPTHFQRVTLWAQILGGVAIFAALQLPRFFHDEQVRSWMDEIRWLRLAWPPFQYAEAFAFASGHAAEAELAAVLAAVLVPLLALWATFALASRYFVAGLQGTLSAPRPRPAWPQGFVSALGRRAAPGLERCGFDLAAALSRREPSFLRGVLPQLVMFQVMSLGMGLGLRRDVTLFIPMSAGFLFMGLPNVLTLSQGTPTPEARSLFASAPLADTGPLLRGGVKALLLQWLALPGLALLCMQLSVGGPAALPRIVLAFALTGVAVLTLTGSYRLYVPFTRAIRFGESKNLGLVVLSGFVMMLIVGLHAALALHPLATAAGVVLAAVVIRDRWRRLGRLRPLVDRPGSD